MTRRWANRAANALAVAAVIAVLVVLRPGPLGGGSALTVISGNSMEPTMSQGDAVLALRHSSYNPGDIVVYRIPDGPATGRHVIHRLVERTPDGWVTQGDNRDTVDPWRPTDSDIVGVAAVAVPGAGNVVLWLGSRTAVVIIAALLAASITHSVVTRRCEDADGSGETPTGAAPRPLTPR